MRIAIWLAWVAFMMQMEITLEIGHRLVGDNWWNVEPYAGEHIGVVAFCATGAAILATRALGR